MRRTLTIAALALACSIGTAATAQADVRLNPFAGVTFGGDAPANKFAGGLSVTFMGAVAGFEFDMGYAPDFFNENPDFALVGDSNVTTFTGNVIVGPGRGKVQPYGVFGLGLVRTRVSSGDELFDDVTTNDFGLSIGGGVLGMLSDNVGLRGDLRYFRSLQDNTDDNDLDVTISKFGFWRGSVGLTFKF